MPSRVQCLPNDQSDDDQDEENCNQRRSEDDEDSGTDSYEDPDTGSQQFSPEARRNKKHRRQVPTQEPRIKKKKRRSGSTSDEEVRQRRPLKESFHQNRQQQRLHNTMGKGSKRRAAARSKTSDDDETVDADTIQQQQQVEDLQLEVRRLKKRQKLLTKVRSKSRAKGGKKSAMSREVQKIAKADLWSLKKFIYDDPGLYKATKWVLGRLGDLVEMEGMSAQDRADAEEEWIVKHSDDVRTGLNTQRNYTMAELRTLVLEFYDENKEAELPTEKQMYDIVMRKGFTGSRKASMEAKLDIYWDKIFGKIAGNTLWSNNKKYYQLLSFGTCPSRIEGVDDVPCGHYSTEAMVCGVYENYLVRWKYEALQKRNGDKVDVKHEDYKTKGYVNAICGRAEYGGWTTAGKKRIHELSMLIKKNRKDNEAEIRAIEQACLDRLRTLHNRAEIDAKKKAPRAKKGAAYDPEPEDSDDEQWGFV